MNEKSKSLSLCRLCLSYTSSPVSLITNSKNSEMLEALTTIKISPTDDISTVSCFKCLLSLKLAFTIQQNILKAEQRFRERFLSVVKLEFHVDEVIENVTEVDQLATPKFEEYSNDVIINREVNKLSLEAANFNTKQEDVPCVDNICGIEKTINKNKSEIHMEVDNVESENVNDTDGVLTSEVEENLSEMKSFYVCKICGKDMKTMIKLKNHKYNVHRTATCAICFRTVKRCNMLVHMQIHSKKTYVCDICGITVKHLKNHIRYKHQNIGHKCKFCDKIFHNSRDKANHEVRDHNDTQ